MKKKPTVREFYRNINDANAIPNIDGQVNFTADQMIWFGEQVLNQLSERSKDTKTSYNYETKQLNILSVSVSLSDEEVSKMSSKFMHSGKTIGGGDAGWIESAFK